jgi:hypothetical protein
MDYKTALYIIAGIMLLSCVLPFIARASVPQEEQTVEAVAGS